MDRRHLLKAAGLAALAPLVPRVAGARQPAEGVSIEAILREVARLSAEGHEMVLNEDDNGSYLYVARYDFDKGSSSNHGNYRLSLTGEGNVDALQLGKRVVAFVSYGRSLVFNHGGRQYEGSALLVGNARLSRGTRPYAGSAECEFDLSIGRSRFQVKTYEWGDQFSGTATPEAEERVSPLTRIYSQLR